MAFSPKDWKESFKTSFGFIFQRLSLGILWPEDLAWHRGIGGVRGERRGSRTSLLPQLSLPPKIIYKEKKTFAARAGWGAPPPALGKSPCSSSFKLFV